MDGDETARSNGIRHVAVAGQDGCHLPRTIDHAERLSLGYFDVRQFLTSRLGEGRCDRSTVRLPASFKACWAGGTAGADTETVVVPTALLVATLGSAPHAAIAQASIDIADPRKANVLAGMEASLAVCVHLSITQ
jgi:hypothetical protein